jgi:spore photoproduct lyase
VIKNFEPGTSPFEERIAAARKVAQAGYPLGFIVAPIYRHDEWVEGYHELFQRLHASLKDLELPNLSFEMIQHRFTKPAKKVIQQRYPNTKLEMDEEKRKYKWGRYGIGKYVYPTDEAAELEGTIRSYIAEYFPQAEIQYFT